eukprot:maker-scaffold_54-snap-gene-1.22-mRNA-1 protein AED:0.20 eAED:0.20 QI:76/1/1/1/1/1/3/1480/160
MHHIYAAMICFAGAICCFVSLFGEYYRWKSYGQFSIATKVPVQICGLNGPIAFLCFLLYNIFGLLLITETGTTDVFYFSTFWTVFYLEMGLDFYDSFYDMVKPNIDKVIHFTNLFTMVYSFVNVRKVPYTFVALGGIFWGFHSLRKISMKHRTAKQNTRS